MQDWRRNSFNTFLKNSVCITSLSSSSSSQSSSYVHMPRKCEWIMPSSTHLSMSWKLQIASHSTQTLFVGTSELFFAFFSISNKTFTRPIHMECCNILNMFKRHPIWAGVRMKVKTHWMKCVLVHSNVAKLISLSSLSEIEDHEYLIIHLELHIRNTKLQL